MINTEILGVSIGKTPMDSMRGIMEILGYRDNSGASLAYFRKVLYGGIVWGQVFIKPRLINDTVGEIRFSQEYTETLFNSLAAMLTQKYGQLVTKQTETEIEITDGNIMVSLCINEYDKPKLKKIGLTYSLIERRYIDAAAF